MNKCKRGHFLHQTRGFSWLSPTCLVPFFILLLHVKTEIGYEDRIIFLTLIVGGGYEPRFEKHTKGNEKEG